MTNNAETKMFPILDVLAVVSGRLLREDGMSGVYQILNWMTGESVYTHQIPRVMREAITPILTHNPSLKSVFEESDNVTSENYKIWRNTWVNRYDAEIAIPKMTIDEHESIDPLSELAEQIHPSNIIVIKELKNDQNN